MEVVLDTNILLRTLISQGNILNLFFDNSLVIYAPERLKEELSNNKKEILEKSLLNQEDFDELLERLFERIIFMGEREYAPYLSQARELLKTHQKDEEFIALCLLKNIKLWTYEDLIFRLGFGISTKEIKSSLILC